MKRARAVELVEQMLRRLDEDTEWPLGLVKQVWLFGSFSRGALQPHDVDVAVRFERDERMQQAVLNAMSSGRANAYAPLRRALAGTSRGLQIQFEDQAREQLQAEEVVMLPLWERGDTLGQALAVLHGIAEDPLAGRDERDDVIEACLPTRPLKRRSHRDSPRRRWVGTPPDAESARSARASDRKPGESRSGVGEAIVGIARSFRTAAFAPEYATPQHASPPSPEAVSVVAATLVGMFRTVRARL